MDDNSLDELLEQRRNTGASSLPANFQQNVRREIRLRSASEKSAPDVFHVWQWLLRPQLVTALLIVAIFIGIGVGGRRNDGSASHTRQALNLDVFGATAPTLPSTLLSSNL